MSLARTLCVVLLLGSAVTLQAQETARPTATAVDRATAPQILAPRPADAARAEYRSRVSALTSGAQAESLAARRLELALWCQQQGLQDEMRQQARALLQHDPEHAAAHRLLGHEQVDGKWLAHDEAMRARGYVQFRGQWLRKYDVAVIEYREQKAREHAQLERELDDCFQRLASSSAATRTKALQQIEARAERLEWPDLGALGRKQKASWDAAWQRYEVTASVRLQNTQLLGLEPYTTSLGVGAPVRLQLPRLQTTEIGTTVVLPAGTGR